MVIKLKNINENIAALEEKIGKLRELKTECEAISVRAYDVVGGGESINVLTAIDEEYANIKNTIIALIDNSVLFFENVKKSLVEADENAAARLN